MGPARHLCCAVREFVMCWATVHSELSAVANKTRLLARLVQDHRMLEGFLKKITGTSGARKNLHASYAQAQLEILVSVGSFRAACAGTCGGAREAAARAKIPSRRRFLPSFLGPNSRQLPRPWARQFCWGLVAWGAPTAVAVALHVRSTGGWLLVQIRIRRSDLVSPVEVD